MPTMPGSEQDLLLNLKKKYLPNLRNSLILILLLIVAIIELLPLLWLFSTSLRLPAQSYDLPPDFLPTSFRWQNYQAVFASSEINFPLFFFNSLKIAIIVTTGQLLTCSLAAFAFARLRFKGRDALFLFALATMMIPGQATIIPYFILMTKLKLIDSHWALILPALTSAFGIFLLRQHFLSLPEELIDAAKIDGAGFFQIYWEIFLPLIGPGLSTLGVFTFIGSWNNFYSANIFLRSWDKFTLPIAMVQLRGYMGSGSIAEQLAAICLSILPLAILFIFGQKFVIESYTRTGIKG